MTILVNLRSPSAKEIYVPVDIEIDNKMERGSIPHYLPLAVFLAGKIL
jgi:hypothetical protein